MFIIINTSNSKLSIYKKNFVGFLSVRENFNFWLEKGKLGTLKGVGWTVYKIDRMPRPKGGKGRGQYKFKKERKSN